MKIIIGTPIHRGGAFVLDKFLSNQKQIQKNCTDCELIFSTSDASYLDELKNLLLTFELKGKVILHKPVKPGYAKSRVWDIASGRESIRQYFLSQPGAERLLFLDSDMTFDPAIVEILEKALGNGDVVFSGYKNRDNLLCLLAGGCFMLKREALEKIRFRCYEFKNGQIICEDSLAEMDLFLKGCRIRKGIFLEIDHYASATEVFHLGPQKLSGYLHFSSNALFRFCLIRTGVAVHYDIAAKGQSALLFLQRFYRKLRNIKA